MNEWFCDCTHTLREYFAKMTEIDRDSETGMKLCENRHKNTSKNELVCVCVCNYYYYRFVVLKVKSFNQIMIIIILIVGNVCMFLFAPQHTSVLVRCDNRSGSKVHTSAPHRARDKQRHKRKRNEKHKQWWRKKN